MNILVLPERSMSVTLNQISVTYSCCDSELKAKGRQLKNRSVRKGGHNEFLHINEKYTFSLISVRH